MKIRAITFSIGLMMAASLSTAYAHYECIRGNEIELRPPGNDGSAGNHDLIQFSSKTSIIRLSRHADAKHQIYAYSVEDGAWIYGDDWCYAPQSNMIRLTRMPPRLRQDNDAGAEVKEGSHLGVGYVPIIP